MLVGPAAVKGIHRAVGQLRIGIFGQHGAHDRLGIHHPAFAQGDHQQRDVGQVGIHPQVDSVLQVRLRRREIIRPIIINHAAHEVGEPVVRAQVDDPAVILDDGLVRIRLIVLDRLRQHVERQRPVVRA